MTVAVNSEPRPSSATPADTRDQLAHALQQAQRLLGRRSAARRVELAEGLQQLSDAVATAVRRLSDGSAAPTGETADQTDAGSDEDVA